MTLAAEPAANKPAPLAVESTKPARLASLDIFRGLTIAAMILANNSGAKAYAPLKHADWHGWTVADLIFPFFLFIVGVAVPFSLAKRAAGAARSTLLGHIWVRALALVLLGQLLAASNLPWPLRDAPDGFFFTKTMRVIGFVGVYTAIFALLIPWRWQRVATWLPVVVAILFYGYWIAMHYVRDHAIRNGWPEASFGGGIFNPDQLRIPGVLPRIGVCYGVAATIALFTGWRTVLFSAVLLCAAYAAIMLGMKPDGMTAGSLAMEDNVARRLDTAIFNFGTHRHAYRAYPDPEGILSTLPAIASVLLGILAGYWLRSSRTPTERCASLLAVAGPVVLIGIALHHALMPINKNLWTPSFTVFTAGMAMLVLGTIFYLCDVLGRRLWAWPWSVFGMNAIAAFVAAALITRISRLFPITIDDKPTPLLTLVQQWVKWTLTQWSEAVPWVASDANLSLAYATTIVLIIFVPMWVLYVFRIFVKV